MIRERILGAWELVSFVATLPDGREVSAMGRNAGGSIVYTPDYVSANLSRADRPRPMPELEFHHLPPEVAGALAIGYMAYAGPYSIDEGQQMVTHDFRVCLDPALVGTVQQRHVRFVGDRLELSVRAAPGVPYPSALLWRRPGE